MTCGKYDDYRPTVFWGWNDKLDQKNLDTMIDVIKNANIGGIFPHARSGLKQEYLGNHWMEAFSAVVKKCKENGMKTWVYDEDGWPSGYAGSKVCMLGEYYQQKYLVCEHVPYQKLNISKYTLALYEKQNDGKYHFCELAKTQENMEYLHIYYDVCPYYVDIMDKETIKKFIEVTYEFYYEKNMKEFGAAIPGTFTDEPQYSRNYMPWSNKLRETFLVLNGYDIIPNLFYLYIDIGNYKEVRYNFWKTVNFMFTENYTRQISTWCKNHNVLMTGHYIGEESISDQMAGSCNIMGHLQYMDIPGMDWLGRDIGENPITPKQVASVAAQLGKQRVMSEMFAASGNGATFADLKFLLDWQVLFGANMPCYSILPNTLEGCRKRDYPPFFTPHQENWQLFNAFNKYAENICRIMGESEQRTSIAVIHPIRSAWALYSPGRVIINNGVSLCMDETASEASIQLKEIDKQFSILTGRLAEEHFDYHFVDEEMLSLYGSIDGTSLTVGKCRYNIVIVLKGAFLDKATVVKLSELAEAGCTILALGGVNVDSVNAANADLIILRNKVVSCVTIDDLIKTLDSCTNRDMYGFSKENESMKNLYCSKRFTNDGVIFFILNKSDKNIYGANIFVKEKGIPYRYSPFMQVEERLDYVNVDGGIQIKMDFSPRESIILMLHDSEKCYENNILLKDICHYMPSTWEIEESSLNALILDYCSFSTDNGETWDYVPIIKVHDILIKKRFEGRVLLKFEFQVDDQYDLGNNLYLGIENITEHKIKVNGNDILQTEIKDTNIDVSIKCLDVTEHLYKGRNEVVLEKRFCCSDRVFNVLTDPKIHETELTRLTFDVEIENIYILGRFKLESGREAKVYKENCYKTEGPFKIKNSDKTVDIQDITKSGYYFFNGSMLLKNGFTLENTENERVLLRIKNVHASGFSIHINSWSIGNRFSSNETIDITDWVLPGENTVFLRLYTNLRNILGPFHHIRGDPHTVCSDNFTDKKGWTDINMENDKVWSDSYFFTGYGVEGPIQIIVY